MREEVQRIRLRTTSICCLLEIEILFKDWWVRESRRKEKLVGG